MKHPGLFCIVGVVSEKFPGMFHLGDDFAKQSPIGFSFLGDFI